MTGPGGLETALLLVRRTPLPPDTDLAGLIGPLPPSPLRDAAEVAVRGFDGGRATAEVKRGAAPGHGRGGGEGSTTRWLRLMERLRTQLRGDQGRAVRLPGE